MKSMQLLLAFSLCPEKELYLESQKNILRLFKRISTNISQSEGEESQDTQDIQRFKTLTDMLEAALLSKTNSSLSQ